MSDFKVKHIYSSKNNNKVGIGIEDVYLKTSKNDKLEVMNSTDTAYADIESKKIVLHASEGTAPIELNSSTKVNNLNSDKVDGCDINDSGTGTSDLWTANKIISYTGSLSGTFAPDEDSIDLNTSNQAEVKGFETAQTNQIPYKKSDGTIGWKAESGGSTLNTSNFNGILSSNDDTVQKALDTLDNYNPDKTIYNAKWSSLISYSINDIVSYGGKIYKSLSDLNLDNQPDTATLSWCDITSIAIDSHISESDPHTQYILDSEKQQNNGIATLDSNGKVPSTQLNPSVTSKVGTIIIPGSVVTGSKNIYVNIPYAGTLSSANTCLVTPSSSGNAVIALEKASAPSDDATFSFSSVATCTLAPNKRVGNFSITNSTVSVNDYFRINVTTQGSGAIDIIVQFVVTV